MSQSWHLAIESSGLGGSIALFQHDEQYRGQLHDSVVLQADKGSVQTLAPAIEILLQRVGIAPRELGSLSVTAGPGSFTGLRVGLATVKMLSWTLNIPVAPVDTLEAIAFRFMHAAVGAPPTDYRLVAAINAFRRQVFTTSWLVNGSQTQCCLPSAVVDADKWIDDPWQTEPEPNGWPLVLTGGALSSYHPLLRDGVEQADAQLWQPMAEHVGLLGLRALEQGKAVSAQRLTPNYIRSSAAEENASPKPKG